MTMAAFKDSNELIEELEKNGELAPQVAEESSAPSMYYSWARKVHDALADGFPEMSQWETTPVEKAATQACRKALAAVKKAMHASPAKG